MAVAVKNAESDVPAHPMLIFSDRTGEAIDVDTRGTDDAIIDRYSPPPAAPRGRGRPRLGVVAREVTLLLRHWDWLGDPHLVRRAHAAASTFMHALAGNLNNFEEAARALFANDRARFEQLVTRWPHDIRVHATLLAFTHAGSGE